MEEIWKNIKEYEDYQVSNLGRVKSLKFGKEIIMSQKIDRKGYLCVNLCKNGKHKKFSVHRLVAEAFIPNPNNYPQVNHKSEIKTQNNVENLEWCTNDYNQKYGNCIMKKSKTVLQKDKHTDKVIAEYNSLRDIERLLGYKRTVISKCCNNAPHCLSAYGYKWVFKT